MNTRVIHQVLEFPNGGTTIVPVCKEAADEGLMYFLHSDADFFRDESMELFDDIISGETDGEEISGNRTVLNIQQRATTITDSIQDEDGCTSFPMVVIGTAELRELVLAWHAAQDAFAQESSAS